MRRPGNGDRGSAWKLIASIEAWITVEEVKTEEPSWNCITAAVSAQLPGLEVGALDVREVDFHGGVSGVTLRVSSD